MITPRSAAATLVGTAMITTVLGGCGTTYVDTSITVPPSVEVPATTMPPVPEDSPTADLLAEIDSLMRGLDEQIVDDLGQRDAMDRIDALWAVADRQMRAVDPDDVVPFQQAIDLARTGVDRRRPADASKAYRILVSALEAYATPA